MALNRTIYYKFRFAFEQKCFRLIIEAYHTSLTEKMIQLDWNENDISYIIHQNINTNPLSFKWRISTNVEHPIPKDNILKVKGFSDKLPRIDFRFTTFSKSDDHDYFFEAKNLKQNDSALKHRYINTGINNFVSGKYPYGSLVGYLLEGKTDETIKGINRLLEKDKRTSEILIFKDCKLFKDYFESNHPRIGILKHLIFDLTPISN